MLENPPAKVFKQAEGLVLRQELIARNRLAIDTHWTYVKKGYPWSILTKEPGRDVYDQAMPYGSAPIRTQPVPNKAWDVIRKTTMQLLQDFPQVQVEPASASDRAQFACEMAERFLTITAGAEGTNDEVLFKNLVEKSLTCASAYVEVWESPVGGGYMPLQIKAHPTAASPEMPYIGADGNPTTDLVLRYVTPQDPESGQRQFTDDPSHADQQWLPAIRTSKWQREHIRTYPESEPVERAQKVIILGYCTLGEARERWEAVGKMGPDDLNTLCDWTPVRYLPLLPPFQRGRWKLTDGRDKEKAGSSDERIMFYYHVFCRQSPDYPQGADVVVSGAEGGLIIERRPLSAMVTVPGEDGQPKQEMRALEIPVVQVTPNDDPDEMDPTGCPYIELFAGAVENSASMAQGFNRALDIWLHLEKYMPATSPVQGDQIEDSRRTGDAIPISKADDKPVYGQAPPLPDTFFRMYELADESVNSIASTERAATGQDNSKERSGKALQIAVGQNNIGLSGLNTALNTAYTRFCRIKIERCMASITPQQQVQYVGDDGSYKQDAWSAMDFALVGKVRIKTGTGTLMTPENKVQYLGNLTAAHMLGEDEAAAAARPAFSDRLGLPPDPQAQRVKRQIEAFGNGPPQGWVQHFMAFQQAKQVADQQNAQAQAAFQQAQAQEQAAAQNAAQTGQPFVTQPLAPPAPAQPMDPTTGQPMAPPWTPFAELPMDSEPMIASMRQRELRNLMASVDFSRQPPQWQQVAVDAYTAARNAVAAAQPQPSLPHGVTIGVKADASSVGAAEQAAVHPAPAAPQAPPAPAGAQPATAPQTVPSH